jgi:hypothetical protein
LSVGFTPSCLAIAAPNASSLALNDRVLDNALISLGSAMPRVAPKVANAVLVSAKEPPITPLLIAAACSFSLSKTVYPLSNSFCIFLALSFSTSNICLCAGGAEAAAARCFRRKIPLE